ncbi:putative Ig domain-containing protein [Blastopirellula marina]|uniref:Cadherin domain-containing protein n=1 Tax=Blastopirellula marina TaxID=124 RepID=A0A2S8GEG3_9BACT|nr:putative Ig domain-containing protein [Blastopirellula marina]PQO42484.1 hypothetical protein C5Y93_29605 [Blastopirellula marina]
MTQRERILAILVGVLAVGVGGFYFMNQYMDALKKRDRQITALEKQLREEDFKEAKANDALSRLNTYQQHSLPENRLESSQFYQEWLRATATGTGFDNVQVKPNGKPTPSGKHIRHGFSVTGRATMEEFVQFSYEFFSFNILHKLTNVTIRPTKESDELDINMTVSVLGMEGASGVPKLDDVRLEQLARGDAQAYLDKIVPRNIFAQANKPPKITSKPQVDAEKERELKYRLSATDPDEDDKVSFFLGEDAPEGLEVTESGSLVWTPKELGEYTVTVEARDNRFPPKSTTQQLVINVTDPPPPEEPREQPPSFDEAKYTFLTGTVAVGGQPKAWLNNRPKNQQLRLAPGESFTIGTLKGKVIDVRDREVIIEIEGNQRLLSIGQPLADAAPMGPS